MVAVQLQQQPVNPPLSQAQVDVLVDALVGQTVTDCIEPAFAYFEAGLTDNKRAASLKMFDAARYFHPGLALENKWTAAVVASKLPAITFVEALRRQQILAEMPAYLALAQLNLCTRATDAQDFWNDAKVLNDIPATAYAARACMLVAPSSAVAERGFSTFKALFGDLQQSALGDYESAALIARCNA